MDWGRGGRRDRLFRARSWSGTVCIASRVEALVAGTATDRRCGSWVRLAWWSRVSLRQAAALSEGPFVVLLNQSQPRRPPHRWASTDDLAAVLRRVPAGLHVGWWSTTLRSVRAGAERPPAVPPGRSIGPRFGPVMPRDLGMRTTESRRQAAFRGALRSSSDEHVCPRIRCRWWRDARTARWRSKRGGHRSYHAAGDCTASRQGRWIGLRSTARAMSRSDDQRGLGFLRLAAEGDVSPSLHPQVRRNDRPCPRTGQVQ